MRYLTQIVWEVILAVLYGFAGMCVSSIVMLFLAIIFSRYDWLQPPVISTVMYAAAVVSFIGYLVHALRQLFRK